MPFIFDHRQNTDWNVPHLFIRFESFAVLVANWFCNFVSIIIKTLKNLLLWQSETVKKMKFNKQLTEALI